MVTSDLHSKKSYFEKRVEKILERGQRRCWESGWQSCVCVGGGVGSGLARVGGRRERRDGWSGEELKKVNP